MSKEILPKKRPKVGVVIGSGGIKAFGAVELFDFLALHQIPIDLIVGCSGGACMAALKGLGFTTEEMKNYILSGVSPVSIQNLDFGMFGAIFHVPGCSFKKHKSLFKPDPIINRYCETAKGKKIEDLCPRIIIQATDIETGEEVRLTSGSLAEAVYASGALIPFLPPMEIDGRTLIDGAFTNSVPITTAIAEKMDLIIVMEFQEKKKEVSGLLEGMENLLSKSVERHKRLQMLLVMEKPFYEIIYIRVIYTEALPFWDVDTIPFIFEKTRSCVNQKQDEIIDAYDNFFMRHQHV